MFKTIGQVANYKPIARCGMEELAEWQKTVKPSSGILFARKTDGEEKTKARQLILDLFAPDVWDRPLNMLTMPGVHWRFERMLLSLREPGWTKSGRTKRTHFTGVENDRSIYYAAAAQMPGTETPNRLIRPVKRERFPFAEHAIKTRHASFFFANVDDMLLHDWQPALYREQSQVGWDAVWLDYTGPLSIQRLVAIRRFFRRMVRDILIVTALKARWDRDTSNAIERSGGHSEWLRGRLHGEVQHDVEYFDTSPMAQIAIRKARQ